MNKIAQSIASGSHNRLSGIEAFRRRYYSDIDPLFSIDKDNDVKEVINIASVQNSMIGIISTRKGERPFEPEFGCNIYSSLFENMTDFSAFIIEKAIQESVDNYEPRVSLKRIDVIPEYDQNTFFVSVDYHVITDLNYIYNLKVRLRDN